MSTPERLIIEAMFMIANKDGEDVDFILNSAQAQVDGALTGRDIIPKARQEGVSSYFLARNLARCLSKRNTRAVVISHDSPSTERMLTKVHYMIEHMKGAKPILKNASRNMITFPKMDSMYYIGTAGSKAFGRGDTISDLHCSEVAYWEDAGALMTGLLQAVPMGSGNVSIESTGNGRGNWYHQQCLRAYLGQSSYKLHFLPWHTFKEYDLLVSKEEAEHILSTLDLDYEEDKLVEIGLTPGQLKFRRIKLMDEMNYDVGRFKAEYPMTFDECFQATGRGLFQKYRYVPTENWKRINQFLWGLSSVYENPQGRYLIGCDPSGGVGADDSVMEIINLDTFEQVGEWVSNRTDPERFAHHIVDVAKHFNQAYVTCESNNHGVVTMAYLKKNYPMSHLFRQKHETDNVINYGFRTSVKSKPMIIGELRTVLVEDMVIHSPYLVDELGTFIEKENGKLEAEEGCKDDCVMALALAQHGHKKARMLYDWNVGDGSISEIADEHDPGSFDAAVASIKRLKQTNVFPIRGQVA